MSRSLFLVLAACNGAATPSDAVDTDSDVVFISDASADTGSDTGVEIDAGAASLAFTLCGAEPHADVVARIHTCTTPCTGDLSTCAWDSTAETGWPSRSVRFVAEGRAGVLRYSDAGSSTLFVHNGGTGTTFAPRTIPDAFVAAGGRVVEVAWHTASATGTECEDDDCGWLTRPLDDVPSSIEEVSARPAAVIQWAHDNLGEHGAFGTVSCSAGSLATFYARYFHDLDPSLDYQMLLGGPLIYDASWGCSGRTTGCTGEECGRCRTDPSVTCTIGGPPSQCLGAGGSCASYRLTGTLGLLERLYLNDDSCPVVAGTDYAGGDMATAPGDDHVEHPMDILIDTNGLPQLGDDDLGISPNAWEIRQALSGPDITFGIGDGTHCQAFTQTSTCVRVLDRMGLDGATVCPGGQ